MVIFFVEKGTRTPDLLVLIMVYHFVVVWSLSEKLYQIWRRSPDLPIAQEEEEEEEEEDELQNIMLQQQQQQQQQQ